MSRTSYFSLALAAVISAVLGWALQLALVFFGYSLFVFPISMSWTLGFCSLLLVLFSWPISNWSNRSSSLMRQNPWFGARILIFAKSGSKAGSVFFGLAGGFLFFLAGRPVFNPGAFFPILMVFVAALFLIIGGLLAEKWCLISPNSKGDKNV